jgi:hypothetical protein
MSRKPNISALARKHGLSIQTVHGRLQRGWSLKKALSPRLFPGSRRPDTRSIAGRARAHGLPAYIVYDRLRRMPLKRALTKPVRGGGVSALARKHGMSPQVLHHRLEIGMPMAKALSMPVRRGGKLVKRLKKRKWKASRRPRRGR